ncbi:queuosine precursor transporter [Candidatus Thiosymbion oneisti]|uniref:queuosine precursor transporter n=1 Tax=Candidatus Thiosymbion oneisti TaxID=589554 RepID=UPI000B7F8C29|nr:queuosine precursor transporter [Candidatus Thiosymbion oneisti]
MTKDTHILIGFGTIYAALLVAANAAGTKIIAVGSLAASATVFVYALTFLVTDIVSDVYGKKAADKLVIYGFVSVLLAVVIYQLAIVAPPAPFFQNQEAYESVFGVTWRLLLGGLVAYLISQFLDIRIFHYIREKTNTKHLWLRNVASTLISQFVDTVIFITVAFYGVFDDLFALILGQYLIKLVIALLDTPFAYLGISIAKRFSDGEYGHAK